MDDVYVNRDSLSAEGFPLTYYLNGFESRVAGISSWGSL